MYLNKQLLLFFEDCKNRKLDIALTTVIKTTGSSFSKTGNTMLVNSKNEFTGVLGSKFLQEKVKESSKIALEKKKMYILNQYQRMNLQVMEKFIMKLFLFSMKRILMVLKSF